MVEEMVKFLSACPHICGHKIKINYLEGSPLAFSVKMLAENPVVKRYSDGGAVCEARFALAIRQEYGKAEAMNRDAAVLCENIEEWLDEQGRQGKLPALGEKAKALSLYLSKSFGVTPSGSIGAKFEAELRLVYYVQYLG